MSYVLIVDQLKASMVMTSEVFKDKIPGIGVKVTSSAKEAMEFAAEDTPRMIVVDFDLPDTDGVVLIRKLRKTYDGPILLTAFPDEIVDQVVESELFTYADASSWVPKPVRFEAMAERIEEFLVQNKRLCRRFETKINTVLIGKGAGRGKRAPKIRGNIVNLSMGGAQIDLSSQMNMCVGDEVTITFEERTPHEIENMATDAVHPSLSHKKEDNVKPIPAKLKGSIAWANGKDGTAGVQFSKLTESQKRSIEDFLRFSINCV